MHRVCTGQAASSQLVASGAPAPATWPCGYSATSLEQLSDATDLNRPSLHAAFGDKRALYLRTLGRYTEISKRGIVTALDPKLSLASGLRRFYELALSSYLPPGDRARGCYLIGTAVLKRSVMTKFAPGWRPPCASSSACSKSDCSWRTRKAS